ncbi:hypothetical protein DPEC_G00109070 [Dallia pectoralis]|uniref:Uncharacterized protein n=1 Tax=Dallia pectoralis TaxID=75939 RepID=A0ACC2GS98_DALPE|nr:hypothetical protein DPEC_G00109070 [Dallia pectoralis]
MFSSSTQRWEIFKTNVPQTILKAISNTRWECRVESVKVLRYQLPAVGEALLSLVDQQQKKVCDSETASAARDLEQEITSWKFLLTVIIWYNILHEVHRVSKLLQSPQVGIDVLQYENTERTAFHPSRQMLETSWKRWRCQWSSPLHDAENPNASFRMTRPKIQILP